MLRTLFLSAALALPAAAAPCPSLPSWPTNDWPERELSVEKSAAVTALETLAFTRTGTDEDRAGVRTESLLLIHNGELIFERYAGGFDKTKRHLSWSVAKSISSTLIGIAVQQGALTLEDPICQHLPQAPASACDIRVKDLLTFASGQQWQEEYENGSYQTSSVISMLFGEGHRDQVGFVLKHRRLAAPGTAFVYSTGDAHVLATVAKNALGKAHGPDAFWTELFDKVGMRRVVVEEDRSGAALGGAFIYATPRDYAKLGYLFLNDGCWAGERLVPEGWVTAATTPSAAFLANRGRESQPNGYMWWLNVPLPAQSLESTWKDAPVEAYSAIGHWGQYVIVLPAQKLIIVRTGDDREHGLSMNELIRLSLEVVR